MLKKCKKRIFLWVKMGCANKQHTLVCAPYKGAYSALFFSFRRYVLSAQ